MVSFISMVWLHEHSKHDLVDLVFYLPFHTRVEFLRIAVHCLMIKILAKKYSSTFQTQYDDD